MGHAFRRRKRSKAFLSPAAAKRRAREATGSSEVQISHRRGGVVCHAPRPTPAEAAETASQRGPFPPAKTKLDGPPQALLDKYGRVARPAEDKDLRILDPRRCATTKPDGIGPIPAGERSAFYIPGWDEN